ncbi:NFATC2-interacting protein [Erpetoichthys calabaricus]|uniref:NFATC2-interacting protein n=1 Tax=Erpetoichthys calabaricus TaxID=27687 RepID=A0A8C4SRR7_ERPCA|nr:NFATC2-interacting protein [Erpetoichthys calabaricus]
MAEKISESSGTDEDLIEVRAPQPKRRRVLDYTNLRTVPVYSSKVSSSLRFSPKIPSELDSDVEEESEPPWDPGVTDKRSKGKPVDDKLVMLDGSDSEEEPPKQESWDRSPSPPPPTPEVPLKRNRRVGRALRKIRKVDMTLNKLGTTVSATARRGRNNKCDSDEDNDVILVTSPTLENKELAGPREITLKIHCRGDLHRIPVQSTDPLHVVIEQLSVKLEVPPSCILLLNKEEELPVSSTVSALGLGIADIVDCIILARNPQESDGITLRLQGKDKDSVHLILVKKDAPLALLFHEYRQKAGLHQRKALSFLFDGEKLTEEMTAAQLDMEDGDVVEVWQ